MKKFTILALVLGSSAAFCWTGCSIGEALTNRAPSISARLVNEWQLPDYLHLVRQRRAGLLAMQPAGVAKSEGDILLSPFVDQSVLTEEEIGKYAKPEDMVCEYIDVLDGRAFFCVKHRGYIVKTYCFENRPRV
jgi:hypothetical protein